jgi:hypothetical protein
VPPKSLPHEGWVGRPGDGGKLKPFAACCVILSVADRLVMFEAVDQIRCFRSGADAGRAVGRGVRIARCGNDVCRARVLQEDGGTVRGHGDGEIPSLLSADRLAKRFACREGLFSFSGSFGSRGSSGTTDLGAICLLPFANTNCVSGLLQAEPTWVRVSKHNRPKNLIVFPLGC